MIAITRYVDTARGPGRLVAFEFSAEQVYLVLFTDRMIDIYRAGARIATLAAPWSVEQLRQLTWTQSADTLLIAQSELAPKQLTRGPGETWSLTEWPIRRINAPLSIAGSAR